MAVPTTYLGEIKDPTEVRSSGHLPAVSGKRDP